MAITLGSIITQIRERCDLTNSEFITDSEITNYINYSLGELYGLLVNAYGGTYFSKSSSLLVPGGSRESAALPLDLYKVLGVDINTGGYVITMQPYNFNQRNMANNFNIQGQLNNNYNNYTYNILESKLLVQPVPNGDLNLSLWYVPVAPQFLTTTTGVTAATTAPELAVGQLNIVAPNDFRVGQQIQKLDTLGNPTGQVWIVVSATATAIVLREEDETTVANLTSFFNQTGGDNIGSPSVNLFQTFSNNSTLNGWLEYVIVDVSIKCKVKEESDTSMFVRAKALLTERIRTEAQARDIGTPATVSDVYTTGNGQVAGMPFANSYYGWGGNWGG